uniref:Uncharacterized protein n=1 Tax=Thermosporothrix sp. COM3 TaxID=2490863 RepID=A0A455SNY1_9CHLR|nr:hypothetical protein KTC_15550 [Thermosporothrix sp. COM3]
MVYRSLVAGVFHGGPSSLLQAAIQGARAGDQAALGNGKHRFQRPGTEGDAHHYVIMSSWRVNREQGLPFPCRGTSGSSTRVERAP